MGPAAETDSTKSTEIRTGANYSAKCDMCLRFINIREIDVFIWDVNYHHGKGKTLGGGQAKGDSSTSLSTERVSVCFDCNPTFCEVYAKEANLVYKGKHGYRQVPPKPPALPSSTRTACACPENKCILNADDKHCIFRGKGIGHAKADSAAV